MRLPELDVAINVSATLVAGAVAILGWVRWLEQRESTALFESSAFLMLMSTNLLTVGAVLGRPAGLGPAVFLLAGAFGGIRGEPPGLPPLIVVFLPATSMLVLGI